MSRCCRGGCGSFCEVGYTVLLFERRYELLMLPASSANVIEALIGTVEELGVSPRTQTLVREQFETNFFGPVNVIKAALPAMRKRNAGHIVILTCINQCWPLPLGHVLIW